MKTEKRELGFIFGLAELPSLPDGWKAKTSESTFAEVVDSAGRVYLITDSGTLYPLVELPPSDPMSGKKYFDTSNPTTFEQVTKEEPPKRNDASRTIKNVEKALAIVASHAVRKEEESWVNAKCPTCGYEGDRQPERTKTKCTLQSQD